MHPLLGGDIHYLREVDNNDLASQRVDMATW